MITTNPRAKQQAQDLLDLIKLLESVKGQNSRTAIKTLDTSTIARTDVVSVCYELRQLRWNDKLKTMACLLKWIDGLAVQLERKLEEFADDQGWNMGSMTARCSGSDMYIKDVKTNECFGDGITELDEWLTRVKPKLTTQKWKQAGIDGCAGLKRQQHVADKAHGIESPQDAIKLLEIVCESPLSGLQRGHVQMELGKVVAHLTPEYDKHDVLVSFADQFAFLGMERMMDAMSDLEHIAYMIKQDSNCKPVPVQSEAEYQSENIEFMQMMGEWENLRCMLSDREQYIDEQETEDEQGDDLLSIIEEDAELLAEQVAELLEEEREVTVAKEEAVAAGETMDTPQFNITHTLGKTLYYVAWSAALGYWWSWSNEDAHLFTETEVELYRNTQGTMVSTGVLDVLTVLDSLSDSMPIEVDMETEVDSVSVATWEQVETLPETPSKEHMTELLIAMGYNERWASREETQADVWSDMNRDIEEVKAHVIDYFTVGAWMTHQDINSSIGSCHYWLRLRFEGTEFGYLLSNALVSMSKQSRKCRAVKAADKWRGKLVTANVGTSSMSEAA
ncbi:hypothetical protein VCRA2127O344_20252 [Vibrio crassostreae]|nr:hypothetical protein VCRA2127O344_20252 [Vibrio crassostreae]